MKTLINIFILVFFLGFSSHVVSSEPKHDDREHEKAERDLDHRHWNEAHGSGVPKDRSRKPPAQPSSSSSDKKGSAVAAD